MADRRELVVGLVMLAMCCLVAAGCGSKETAAPAAPAEPSGGVVGEIPDEAAFVKMGPEDAAVKLVAFYPEDDSHKFIVDYLKEFAEAHPDSVSLTAVDFRTPAGFDVYQLTGLGCAGVLVNGETEWEVETDGATEKVSFTKRMGVLWTEEDFEKVANKLLEEAGASEPAAD